MDAAGAPIEGISSQAKRTMAKFEFLTFLNKNDKRINMLRVG
jgi:hypothetical protein